MKLCHSWCTDFLPDLEGKTLFVKLAHSSDQELDKIKQKLTWTPSDWGLLFKVFKGAMQVVKEEEQLIILTNSEAYELQWQAQEVILSGASVVLPYWW